MSVFHKVSQDVQTLSDAILKGRRDYSSVWVFPISKPQNIYHGQNESSLPYSSCKIYLYRTVPAVGLSSPCVSQSLKHHSFLDGFFWSLSKGLGHFG